MKYYILIFGTIIGFAVWANFVQHSNEPYQKGDMSRSGGSPTYRYEHTPSGADSNDQPLGYYGTDTVNVCNESSGNCYDLDADISNGEVERLYFQKGGWVDIINNDCGGDMCTVEDENGTEWTIEMN